MKNGKLAVAILCTALMAFPSYAGSWHQTDAGWKYLDANGVPVTGQWIDDNGER